MNFDPKKAYSSLIKAGLEYENISEENIDNKDFFNKNVSLLKKYYEKFFDKDFIEERFQLPDDLLSFFSVYPGDFVKREGRFYCISGLNLAIKNTEYFLDLIDDEFFERKAENDPIDADTMWIHIAHLDDRHEIWICVDKLNPRYGIVYDFQDSHPWFPENSWSFYWDSFSHYILK